MYSILQFTCVSFVILYNCYAQFLHQDIKFYEYGQHVEGERVSFVYNGVIPEFKPIYTLNVTSNLNVIITNREELKPGFSYLRVEYYNMMSDVNVSYDPASSLLSFHVKFPFMDTPIGVLGYSVPIK